LTALYNTTCDPEWREEWKASLREFLQVKPQEEHLIDAIIAKLHRQLTGTPEPLPLHILLMIDGLEDEGLRKSICSLGHLENYLTKQVFFTGAFLLFRNRTLDVVFQELEKSNVWCMRPFLGY